MREYLDTNTDARSRAERARDYYDGKQWTQEEIAILKARGQPPIVFNRIKRKVDSILGVERTRRTDPKAYARTPNDQQSADTATEALRFVGDQTRLNTTFSQAFENGMVEGCGAVEVIVEAAGDDVDIKVNLIPWEQFIFDPRSIRHDFSDARYLGMLKWMDADDAADIFSDKAEQIKKDLETQDRAFVSDQSVEDKPSSGQWIDRRRRRVQVCQLYYKQGGQHMYAVVVGNTLVSDEPSYYEDDKRRKVCAIEAFSAYVDRENARYGVVHDMQGPQDEINHRRSKAVHFLHSRRVISQNGAVSDVAAAKREIARPDGWVEEMMPESIRVLDTAAETTGNLNMLQEAKAEIDLLGPNNALQGKGTEDQSGRAIIAQQQAGLAELAPLYDRFNDFKLRVYRSIWHRIKQFWRAPKWVRITDDPQAPQFIGLNQVQGLDPMTGQPAIMNAVAQMDVDIIIETGPDTVTLQGEEFEQLAQIMPQLATVPPPYALALIEASSLPQKRKQKMTELLSGGGEKSPEEQAAAQKQAEMSERAAMAEIGTKEGQAAKLHAEAQSTTLKAQLETEMAPVQLKLEQAKLQDAHEARMFEREKMRHERLRMAHEHAGKQAEQSFRLREMQQEANEPEED